MSKLPARLALGAFATACLSLPAAAQNTGGVFGPVVNDGHSSAQYRITYNPDTEGFAQRAHYQQALNDDLMWRVIGQTRKTTDSDFDFDYVQAELFWQLTDNDQAWQSGVRFDVRLRDDDRPGLLGAHWSNQFALAENWRARAVVLSSIDFGDNAADGLFVQTRGQIERGLENGNALGFEVYSAYGAVDNIRDFDDQNHQVGPYGVVKLNDDWAVLGQVLLGVTDAAADEELRLWLMRRF